jgi:regulator of replication initiation timing
MRPDNTAPIIAAARQRHELTRAKAIRALRELDHTGTAVTFETVARTAGVSRSWLYAQPDLRAEIQRLRALHSTRAAQPAIPTRQRVSDASLRRRLETTAAEIRRLREENQKLRERLAWAHGELRATNTRSQTSHADAATPARSKGPSAIGPCS